MSKVNSLLAERMKNAKAPTQKTALMAQQSMRGNRNPASQFFQEKQLSPLEKEKISALLQSFATPQTSVQEDLPLLLTLTAEVKAIQHQAALLHGERIHQVQQILTRYREGAFSAWLIATYGNRQTPYNFLQYFRFFQTLPPALHPQAEAMPRQALYSLASREGEFEKKKQLIHGYQGETKEQLLQQIRLLFPLPQEDRRQSHPPEKVISLLEKALCCFENQQSPWNERQKKRAKALLDALVNELFSI